MTLLITMGDPAGIGPEIVARAFQRGRAVVERFDPHALRQRRPHLLEGD